MKDPLGKPAPAGGFQTGGWYSGFQYWDGSFAPQAGQIHPNSNQQGAGGNAQVAPENQAFINKIRADQIQAPTNVPTSSNAQGNFLTSLSGEVAAARSAVEGELSSQKSQNTAQMAEARKKEQETLAKIEPLVQPFREELEASEREKLYVNQNFQANQQLVDELDQLLTEGNAYIRQQQEITGLAAVRNPRIQKAMDAVAARVGVIEAVINARNGQISQAYNMIDRSINAIAQDRQDQINYYTTILDLNRRDIVSLDNDSKRLAEEQLNLKKGDLERAQDTADYVKKLMIDPSSALLMGQAGVSLNDSIETINVKLSNAQYQNEVRDLSNEISLQGGQAVVNPSSVPQDQLRSFTDTRGQVHYYKIPKTGTGSSTKSAADYLDFKKTGGTTGSTKGATSSSGPQYSPQEGPGALYVDPTTGEIWQFTNSGWKKVA